jgi:two-component system, NtrC family, nitrogen regulation response regulator NtrX
MSRTILVIDDEEAIRKSVEGALSDEGYSVRTAENAEAGIASVRKNLPDLVLLDIWMPGTDGIACLEQIKQSFPELPVIIMSGHGTIETAVRATKSGAYDFIEKPVELDRMLLLIRNAISASRLRAENTALKRQTSNPRRTLIGKSPGIVQVREMVARIAPTSGSVLITGENGTGKEVVAQMVHSLSPRFKEAFIEVNCAAIPEELIESELFGHERGAFTGAVSARRGRFDLADRGTIFLDEVADMSLKAQAKVLRILQEQRFERVGGSATQTVDVRIIAATNKDIRELIQKGLFREDLYYRLNVLRIQLPPLRERSTDIEELANTFLDEFCSIHKKPRRTISAEALKTLSRYPWPGNIRELRNVVERLVILQGAAEDRLPISGNELYAHLENSLDAPESVTTPGASPSEPARDLKAAKAVFEKEFVTRALEENEWNISKTAEALGIERTYLHRKMKLLSINTAP